MAAPDRNPFLFGAIVSGPSFTDRVAEIERLSSDLRSGQDVAMVGPRRYGKSSLIRRVAAGLREEGVLVASCDLFFTPSKEKLAQSLARAIYGGIASVEQRAERALEHFRRLRIVPRLELDPTTGGATFTFSPTVRAEDVDDTVAALLALPGEIAAERGRPVVLILDEFQEVVALDPHYPRLFRTVFQEQPEVAHVYLGSRRHLMHRLFLDEREPFFRSARQLEIGPIPPAWFAGFLQGRFGDTGRRIDHEAVVRLLAITGGHPHQTQELASYAWSHVRRGQVARPEHVERALVDAVEAGSAYYTQLWSDQRRSAQLVLLALAREEGPVYARAFQERHALPGPGSTQKAIRTLVDADLLVRGPGTGRSTRYRVVDPFLRAWLRRAEGLAELSPPDPDAVEAVRRAIADGTATT